MGKKKNTIVLFGTEVPKSCNIIPKYRRDEQEQKQNVEIKHSAMSRTRKGGRAERMKQDALHGRNADTMHHAHLRHLEKMTEGHGNWWDLVTEDLRNKKVGKVEKLAFKDAYFEGQFLGYNAEGSEWPIYYYETERDYFEGDNHILVFEGRYMDALKKVDSMMAEGCYHAWVPTHGAEVYTLYMNEKGEIMRCYTASDFHEEPGKDNDYGIFPGEDWKDMGVIATPVKSIIKKAVTEYLGFSL